MDPGRYQRIDEIFQAALLEPPGSRAAFLERSCSGDLELRRHVEALLRSHDDAESFMDAPAFALAPEVLSDDEDAASGRLSAGQMLGHHRVIELLGSGGMGEVYLAEDTRLGRRVALKVLHRRMTGDEVSRTRFLREARLASKLEHGNICTIWEAGEADGCCFISMRHLQGQTVRRHIQRREGQPLAVRAAVSIALQVADAVAAAHASGILHRDITAGNVIVDDAGHATVLDFGLAIPLDRSSGGGENELTRPGAIHGTPSYMSPEQARGRELDHRTDIFSFGVVMYEMLTGRLPFQRDSPIETMNAVIHHAQTPAAELNGDVPAELSRIIDRAMAKDPAERYQSVGEMVGELTEVARALDVTATDARLAIEHSGRARPARIEHRRVRAYALASAAALALLAVTFVAQKRSEPTVATAESGRLRSIAVLPFKPLVEAGRDEVLEMGMTDALITRLTGESDLAVRPMSAVRRYTGVDQDPVQAGREQRVDAVLDGSIQQYEEDIRVTIRLIRVRDARVLWARSFDEKVENIFGVQDAISERVARALSSRLRADQRRPDTRDPEAYRSYLLGRFHSQQGSLESHRKSVGHFTKAIETDPEYALAWAGLADSYLSLERFGAFRDKAGYAKAREAASNALRIDDTLAEPHLALALAAEGLDWDWQGAERSYRRAIELNPNHPDAHRLFARFLAAMGRPEEAVAEAERALELAPVSVPVIANLAFTLYIAGQYDRAVEQTQTAIEMNPSFGEAHFLLGLAYTAQRKYEAAIIALQTAVDLTGRMDFAGALGAAYVFAGRTPEAREVLSGLLARSEGERVPSIGLATIYVALGEKENALERLETMVDNREWNVHILRAAPQLDPLRGEPRFEALLRRVGFVSALAASF